jgi:hypothetical protein
MNDKIFDIDINMWDIARKVREPFSFHLFHRHGTSTVSK